MHESYIHIYPISAMHGYAPSIYPRKFHVRPPIDAAKFDRTPKAELVHAHEAIEEKNLTYRATEVDLTRFFHACLQPDQRRPLPRESCNGMCMLAPAFPCFHEWYLIRT
jgi:hypothetical protein